MGLFRLFFVHWVTEDVSKAKNVAIPPVCEVEESEKSILEALKPCFTPKNADFGAFYSPFEGLFEGRRQGSKMGSSGSKNRLFLFSTQKEIYEVREAKKPCVTLF